MIRRFLPSMSVLFVSVALAAMTGCAMVGSGNGPANAGTPTSITMGGKAFGGAQPIGNATVSLYNAGNSGYGLGATLRATTTTATDGSFSFTKGTTNSDTIVSTGSSWACPTAGDPLIYLVATGGNPTGNGLTTPNNTGIALMVPLGACSTVSAATYVFMNEATTVASVAALQQFLNPATRSIGSSSSAMSMQALMDAAATVPNMVDVTRGVAVSTTRTNSGGYNVSGVTVTVTPEITKINTMSNILSSCVNSTSSSSAGCATLFASAVPTNPLYTSQPTLTFSTATDTLMAAYYMLTNPTSGGAAAGNATNLNALMALQVPTSPFQPALTGTPTDWTIGIRYDAGDVADCGPTPAAAKFTAYAYHLAVDAGGNIWAVSETAGNGISEISPTGTPLSCALVGGTNGYSSASIDPAGNIWVSSGEDTTTPDNSLHEWIPGTSTTLTWPTDATVGVFNVVSDGNNNIMFAFGSKEEQIPSATALAVSPSVSANGMVISTTVKSQPYFLAVDATGSIYNSYQGSTTASYETLANVYPSTASGNLAGYKTATFTTGGTNYVNYAGIAVGKAGKVWVLNGSSSAYSSIWNALAPYTPSGVGTGAANTPLAPFLGGVVNGREIAVDGAGNIFAVNATADSGSYANNSAPTYACATAVGSFTTNVGTCWSFSEIADDGTPISATGTGTTTTTVNGGFQKDGTILPYYGRSVAVTPSGNVWIGSNSSYGRGLTEIVGAGVPVVTPLSNALSQGNAIKMP